jgi:hypothetical protein
VGHRRTRLRTLPVGCRRGSCAVGRCCVFGEGGDKLACAWRAGHPVGGSVESRHDIATGASPSKKKSEPSIRIRSCQRARWLMVSFSQNETCCATREEWQSQVNAKSHPLQNEFQFWCFCGTFLYLDTRTTSKTPADGGMLPGEDAESCARPHDVPSRPLRRPRRRRSGRSTGRRDHETCARALSIDQRSSCPPRRLAPPRWCGCAPARCWCRRGTGQGFSRLPLAHYARSWSVFAANDNAAGTTPDDPPTVRSHTSAWALGTAKQHPPGCDRTAAPRPGDDATRTTVT